jgi:uracil-DNA glycosylase
MAPLAEFARRLRLSHPDRLIPDFDPWDGGATARVLYLLEAPGGRAAGSGFVSRNNPDESAKNFFKLNIKAGIPRQLTVIWNAVPWYIGTGTKIRAATKGDVHEAQPALLELLCLLARLEVVVFVGRAAEHAGDWLKRERPELMYFSCPHPSPQNLNTVPANRQKILQVLHKVAERLAVSFDAP